MKHEARIYLSIAFFTWLVVVISHCLRPAPKALLRKHRAAEDLPFFENRAVCRSIRSGETRVGPSLYGVLQEGSGHSEEPVRQVIANGEGTMPAFNEKFEPQEIGDQLEYLRTL
jgi:hypothetical protein